MSIFLDTNILIYALSSDPNEHDKRDIARSLLRGRDCVLSVQVLQEFYVQVTRPSRPGFLSHAMAVEFIESWQRFVIQENTVPVMVSALTIRERYGFSFWDCAVIAAALAAGCEQLFSEDLSNGQKFGSLTVVNPFAAV